MLTYYHQPRKNSIKKDHMIMHSLIESRKTKDSSVLVVLQHGIDLCFYKLSNKSVEETNVKKRFQGSHCSMVV
jgi:hypothetical protein